VTAERPERTVTGNGEVSIVPSLFRRLKARILRSMVKEIENVT
jgi:hypothetical protein